MRFEDSDSVPLMVLVLIIHEEHVQKCLHYIRSHTLPSTFLCVFIDHHEILVVGRSFFGKPGKLLELSEHIKYGRHSTEGSICCY